MNNSQALLHLLHIVSPALPVGAYAYSQGLESAVELGWIKDEDSACNWISKVMSHALARLDTPILLRLYRGWRDGDRAAVSYWNRYLLAARESQELYQEDVQMGAALLRLLIDLDLQGAREWPTQEAASFAAQFALAAAHWHIEESPALQGYLWSWAENQVAAAIKLVPLGQTQAQKLLLKLMPQIPQLVEQAFYVEDSQLGSSLPALALGSMMHEHQYSRLFRS